MLDPSADEVRRWGEAAADEIAQYLSTIRERRVYPQTSAADIRAQLDHELPRDGAGFERLLETFRDVLLPLSRHNGHPRMFGYVQSPGTALAAYADLLASTLNANLTAWRSAPAAVEIERLTIDWIRQILGFEPGAAGLFVSGGSMANLAALATARNAKQSSAGALRIYASRETHHSIAKAAALLGFGRESVRSIEVDERFRIRIDALEAAIFEDRENGATPFCVVGNAGTVNTGACDPLRTIREVADRFGLWMHVDGSYGGFARLAPSACGLFDGIEQADSVALDPHKWLYLPVDCGCVIYRDPEHARATFAHEADYTRVIGQEADEAFAFWDYGPELSRRFRALKAWMLLRGVGLRELSEAIEKDLACARHLEGLVGASDDFEMLAPAELSIFCFRYLPEQFREERDDARLNAFNERLLVALQRDGSSYLSNAMINGRFALRGCVMNYRTTPGDMEILLDDVRRAAAAAPSS
ncbi:MAG TPA: aminotransferase class I/II-fold pyridoxal phosphate-dependent enzyme [Chthoniobacterales bacterium]